MNNKINLANLKNFTKFKDTDGNIEFCDGINVFIGTNGTGKTHLLKILYLISRQLSNNMFDIINVKNQLEKIFKTDSISNLISKYKPVEDTSIINVHAFNSDLWVEIKKDSVQISKKPATIATTPLYIPPQEMLSTYYEFIPIYENYKTGYDLALYDFAKSLNRLELNHIEENFKLISNYILKQICGDLVKDRERFYINYPYGKIEASLLAEGIKKLSTIDYLVKNGSISKNTILFWDEPEVHFNPRLLSTLTTVIKSIANTGVQIFLTTHDHLLSQQLSLLDEYRDIYEKNNERIPPLKFFLLTDSDEGTKIKCGSNLTDLQYNPILEEYLNHHDKEQDLFNLSIAI